jgi:hypothetical protein
MLGTELFGSSSTISKKKPGKYINGEQLFGKFSVQDNIPGMTETGNIDLNNRPRVKNPDDSISTVRSMGVNIDGQEVLIPTVSDDGRVMSDDEAIQQYMKTGKHLGKFKTIEASNAYAKQLHNDQEKLLNEQSQNQNKASFDPFGSVYNSLQMGAGEFNTGLAKLVESPVNLVRTAINTVNPKAQLPEWNPLSSFTQGQAEPYAQKTQELATNPSNQGFQLAGNMLAQIPQDLSLLAGNEAALGSIVSKTPWLSKLGPELQAFVKGVTTAPGYTLSKTAISEGRLPTAEEYGKDLVFFGAAPLGGQAVAKSFEKLLPDAPKFISGGLEGAAEGATGLTATYPLATDEEKSNYNSNYLPTAVSMGLLKAGPGLMTDLSGAKIKPGAEKVPVNFGQNDNRNISPKTEINNRNTLRGEDIFGPTQEIQSGINQEKTQTVPPTQSEQTTGNRGRTKNIPGDMGEDIRVKVPGGKNNADMGGYAYEREAIPPGPEPNPNKNSQSNNQSSSQTSTGAADVSSIEMPELVELVKQINDGKVPHVKEQLGNALGLFSHSNGPDGKGDIKLRADIFKDPALATRVMSHEIGHMVDWLPDKTLSRGNILGRIGSFQNFMKRVLPEKPGALGELTEADRLRLKKQAEQMVNGQKAGTVQNPPGITPKDVLDIWNDVNAFQKNKPLFDYIKKLSGAEKKQILKDAFAGQVNFTLPGQKPAGNYNDWSAEIKAKYQDLIHQEILKRKLFEYETVNNELKNLSQRWKPFDPAKDRKYTAYRFSSKELYADSISVLFNNPNLLKQEAPNFYKAFFNYLENKPRVKAVYEDIQNRLTNPVTTGQNRLEGAYKMLEEGNKARAEAVKRGIPKLKDIPDSLEKLLIDRDQSLLKQIRKGTKQGGNTAKLAANARQELEETKYMAAEANDYVFNLNKSVIKPMSDAGLSMEDMGVYLLAKRASTERSTIANPRGLDEKAAKQMLGNLKIKLGDPKYNALEKSVESYRTLREKTIIPRVESAGMYSPEMIDLMKSSKDYAKFSVTHYLEDTFGGQGTARVYKQIGTLSDIENPFVATVIQDISMLRAAKMNEAKTAALDFLGSIGEIQPAEKVYDANIKGQTAKEPRDPEMKVFSILKDGEMESYYVHKDIAESFEKNPFEATKLAEFAQKLTRPIKEVMVAKNPLWMARNVIRDFKATVKNVPEIRVRDLPKLAKYYNQAFRDVIREVAPLNPVREMFGKKTKDLNRSDDISTMMQEYMLAPNRNYSGGDYNFENEIERLTTEFHVNPGAAIKERGARGNLKRAWDALERFGRVSEMTGKVAGFKYLKNETGLSTGEIGQTVRTRIGTPDARRQGALHQLTNNVFMFSNIGKEGLRSSIEAFNKNRGAFIWKTMLVNVIPKLMLVGAAAFGSDKLKELIAKIPEYDKQMYDVIPMGTNKEGKAVYLRIPQDYEGQMWGALTWALSGGRFVGARGVMDTIGQQNPYNLNPILKIARDLYTYYVKGQNPTDDFRGRPIIPEKAYQAGGWPAHKAMIKDVWQSSGGSAIYTPNDYSEKNMSAMERALKMPGLNVLGAFLKISDRGEIEKYYDEEDKEKQVNARRLIKIEDQVIKQVKQINGVPSISQMMTTYKALKKDGLVKDGTSFSEFRNQYLRYASKVIPDTNLKIVLKLNKTNRKAKLMEYKSTMRPAEYAQLVRNLRKMGLAASD